MLHKEGDKVKVKIPQFKKIYGGVNEWVIDFIKTQTKGYPSLYVCYNVNDPHKLLFQFLEKDVEKI